MKRAFGRHFIADKRDERYLLHVHRTARTSRFWRCGPVTDQGYEPSCVGHAWAGWLAASPTRQRPMLPNGLYLLAQHHDEWLGNDYDGTSVRGGAKLLTMTGHIAEYRWQWKLMPAVNWLLERSPIVLGINWYDGMCYPDSRGLIHASGELLGGHAILWYGVNVKRELAYLRNSWGTEWGRSGNCMISFADLANLLDEDGECCAAVEAIPNA